MMSETLWKCCRILNLLRIFQFLKVKEKKTALSCVILILNYELKQNRKGTEQPLYNLQNVISLFSVQFTDNLDVNR